MQQTSGSSFCCCGDDDEGFVVVSFLSLSPSFLGGCGDGDAVVVVVVCFLLMVHGRYSQVLRLIVRYFGNEGGGKILPIDKINRSGVASLKGARSSEESSRSSAEM